MSESLNEIFTIFNSLSSEELELKNLFEEYSIQYTEEISISCAYISKSINKILKLYPEITEMVDKVKIKAHLKFYYELISKLTYYIKSIVNFQRINEDYYDTILDFINNKYSLINGKYTDIVKNELEAFYSKEKRDELEFFLEKRLNDPFKPKKI